MSSRHSYFVCFILSFGFVGRLDGVLRRPSRSDADARPEYVYSVTPEAVKNTERYRTDVRLSPGSWRRLTPSADFLPLLKFAPCPRFSNVNSDWSTRPRMEMMDHGHS
ncbi:uncharacterized protein APUU_12116S [Aspergillus puulaauensis]|uniref:Secreted protein n=1 Tax=Aspergillus puulaauensis TaxID=1220207 RepID=A0A7R7XDK4_9EURO|nr:uncharacterized protein APUU_12116S [Aspergillus puulaauensis]BCS19288.1 hypothetical protein APUU_12116S [Aspergillus puulaauensis]